MREMHSRASSYLQPEAELQQHAENENAASRPNRDKPQGESLPRDDKTEEIKRESDDSSLILIILMILISQGGADDKLLLALLYLLF